MHAVFSFDKHQGLFRFKDFIGDNMRAEQVSIHEGEDIHMLLTFYMGQNTYERQQFILREMKSEEEMEGTNI